MSRQKRLMSLRRRGVLVVGLPVLALLVAVTSFLVVLLEGRSATGWVAHTRQVQSQLQTVVTLTVDAESGNRGFLLTGDPAYLAPVQAANAQLPQAVHALEALVADNPAELARSRALAGLVANRPVRPVGLMVPSAALDQWLATQRSSTEAIRATVAQMSRVEDGLLTARLHRQTGWQNAGLAVSLTALLAGILTGAVGAWVFAESILGPVRRLGVLGQALVDGGDLPPTDDSLDELGQLSRQLDEVATKLRTRERALDDARAFLEHLVAAGPAVLTRFTPTDGLIYVSGNTERILGIPPDRLRDAGGIAPWVADADRAVLADLIDQFASPDTPDGTERTVRLTVTTDRTRRLALHVTRVTLDGAPQIQGLWLDVTDAHTAQQEIADREARLTAVVEASPEIIQVVDDDLRVVWMSPGIGNVLGVDPATRVGQDAIAPIHPDDQANYAEALRAVRDGHLEEATSRHRRRHADGHEVVIEARARRVSGWTPDGSVLIVGRDITERASLMDELTAARQAAEAASQAKSEFLSRMSHELRTPLNAVLGFAQLLEMDELEPAQDEAIHQIRKAGAHLLDLINEVLDIARIESGHLSLSTEPVLAADVFDEAVELIAPLARDRGITLTAPSGGGCRAYVQADRQRIKQILLNLLSNAIKYNRPRGSVTLSCGSPQEGMFAMTVTDTGLGMPPDDLSRLFTPFERLHAHASEIEGTGVGLALSQGLAQAMGGRIDVTSTPGHGSSFSVLLPLNDRPSDPVTVTPTRPTDGPGTEPHTSTDTDERPLVLYIEDNLANWRLVDQIFTRQRCGRLVHSVQGRRGLELATSLTPDLILLDLHLPDMTGEDILRDLKGTPATADIPVVILTADATPGQARRLTGLGAAGYLTKPINLTELLAWITPLTQTSTPARS